MAPVLEQALAADLKQRGAADGEATAEGVGGQPDRVVYGGSGGGCLGQRGRLPNAGGAIKHVVPDPAEPSIYLERMRVRICMQTLKTTRRESSSECQSEACEVCAQASGA
jgi:hypothetical protein